MFYLFIFLFLSGVHFLVHTINLRVTSPIFADMLDSEIGSSDGSGEKQPEVELTETAKVLEIILPYIYSEYVPPFDTTNTHCLILADSLRSLDKYGVSESLGSSGQWLMEFDHVVNNSPLLRIDLARTRGS